MSFFTSLTGLNAATTQLSVTSNNIANAGTTGFKRSRSDFGDIFATSPLQKASTVVGQGTVLKQVTQEFSQGNIELSGNSLDLAVTGEGFFPLQSSDGQSLFTRNGSFLLDEQNTVVNSAGQFLKVASVDSLGKADFKADLIPLTINPATVGEAIATSNIDFSINFPADSPVLTTVDENNLVQTKTFNPNDATTYAKSSAVTIFDENGNDFLLTFYYQRVQVASAAEPENKWQTHVYLGSERITPALGQSTSTTGQPLFVDKYGNIVPENELPVVLNDNLVFSKFNLDDLSDPDVSVPATARGAQVSRPYLSDEAGVNFAPVQASQSLTINSDQIGNIAARDVFELTFRDSTAAVLNTISTTTPASGRFSLINSGDIEASDVVSLTLTDDNDFANTITTAALSADASAADIVTALNTAHSATTDVDIANIANLANGDRVELVLRDSDGNKTVLRTGNTLATDGVNTLAELVDDANIDQFSVKSTVDVTDLSTIANGEQFSIQVTDESGNVVTLTTGAIADVTAIDLTDLDDIVALMNTNATTNSLDYEVTASDTDTLVVSATAGVPFAVTAIEGDGITQIAGALAMAVNSAGLPFAAAVNAALGITLTSNDDKAFSVSLGSNHSVANANLTFKENISSSTATDLTTTATALTPFYEFSIPVGSDNAVANQSMIEVSRQDGTNFNVALSASNSLSGSAALHDHISKTSSVLTTTATSDTHNGSSLAADATTAEIITALQKSASGTNFAFAANATTANTIDVSHLLGTNFTVETDRLPSATTGLISGTISGATTALTTSNNTSSNVTAISTDGVSAPDLSSAFDLTINEDPTDVNATSSITIDLSALTAPENSALSGSEVAELMTQEINRQFGDQRYFDLSTDASRQFRMTFNETPSSSTSAEEVIDIYVPASATYTEKSLAAEIEQQLQEATGTHIGVAYSRSSKGFVFTPESDVSQLTISNLPASASLTGTAAPNTLFGLPTLSSSFTLDSRGRYAAEVIPNGNEILPITGEQQRYGMKVSFLPNTEEGGTGGSFTIASGDTGDTSAIRIENVSTDAVSLFGFDSDDPNAVLSVVAESGSSAVRGVVSSAARVFGKPVSVDPDETFFVDDLTNQFTVTADSVSETFRLPVGNYNMNSFKNALQNRINSMEDSRGNSISGVVVDFDQTNEIFSFTSGTSGDSSFFQISGASRFGLEELESSVGRTSTYRPPVAEQTANGRAIYVTKDENGVFREYSTDTTTGFSELPGSREYNDDPAFRPLFLDKGELTFDTAGNLISPFGGVALDNVTIGNSGNTLNINIDYEGSTQFSGDFSVNAQSQNGQPNGSLVAVDISDDGLVTASYSNGTQNLAGKIILATFSTPNGLRQLGDSTFLASNESGVATLGEPGGAGYGTIRAGARERANVDLTSELVDLITAQRNFQANAKAIETSSTLTSTIINIRS